MIPGIIMLIVIAGCIATTWGWLTKRRGKYIIRLTDPITRNTRYVSHVDGISNTFEYCGSEDAALVFKDPEVAKSYIAGVDSSASPTILKGGFWGWNKL